MQKVSLQQTVKMAGKSESTLRRDVKKGKVSAGCDARGHLRFDVAELQRVYGELKNTGDDAQSVEQANGKAMTGHDRETDQCSQSPLDLSLFRLVSFCVVYLLPFRYNPHILLDRKATACCLARVRSPQLLGHSRGRRFPYTFYLSAGEYYESGLQICR